MQLKKRSSINVYVLSLVTLGLYDLKWLRDVQNEMRRAGFTVGNLRAMYFIKTMGALCSAVAILLLVIGNTIQNVSPSTDCIVARSIHVGVARGVARTVDGAPEYTQECARQFAASDRASERGEYMVAGFIFIIIFGLVLVPIYYLFAIGWYNSFSLALQAVTGNRLNAYMIVFILSFFTGGLGIALLQNEINRLGMQQPAEI